MIDFENDDLISHFIYCTDNLLGDFVILKNIILTKMKKFGIQKSIFTTLFLNRQHFVSKKAEKRQTYKGKRKIDNGYQDDEGCSTDDLESFLSGLRNQKIIQEEDVLGFLRKKLTICEVNLVKNNNFKHLETYLNPNIHDGEIENSEERYVHCFYRRRSVHLSLI